MGWPLGTYYHSPVPLLPRGMLSLIFTSDAEANRPQTYGRTYWELDELYEKRVPAWRFKSTLTEVDKSQQGRANRVMHSVEE